MKPWATMQVQNCCVQSAIVCPEHLGEAAEEIPGRLSEGLARTNLLY